MAQNVLSPVTFLDAQGEEQSIVLIFEPHQIPFQAQEGSLDGGFRTGVWFATDDCRETNASEPGYIKAGVSFPFSETFKHFTILGEISQPNIRELWIATSNVVQEIVLDSFLQGEEHDCLQEGPVSLFVTPVELIDPDLHETFPPRYTLERR